MKRGQFSLPLVGGICGGVTLTSAVFGLLCLFMPQPLWALNSEGVQQFNDFYGMCLGWCIPIGVVFGSYFGVRVWRSSVLSHIPGWMWLVVWLTAIFFDSYPLATMIWLSSDLNPLIISLGGLCGVLLVLFFLRFPKCTDFLGWA
ncbi:MAG TPA: hypothetical protein VF627_14825 [Abditibacterium sp.]|jgi:hypothetical protein